MRTRAGCRWAAPALLCCLLAVGVRAENPGAATAGAWPAMTDALLIIDAEVSRAGDVLSRVASSLQVTQRLPPRLAIIRGTPGQLEALRQQPGVVALCEGAVPGEVLEQLGPTEQLFAKAWEAGRQPKSRPGEGLPWDAPGFQPPDGPGKH